MTEPLTVLRPGTTVVVGNDLPATLVSVLVETDLRVSYQVVWWDGRTRRCEWLGRGEVFAKAVTPDRLALGFRGDEG